MTIEENVRALLDELKGGNPFGEEVRLVAATKTRTAEEICRAVSAGITDIGENRVQEYLRKYDAAMEARRHFIGHLQLNKVKYLIGKTDLIHSVDRDELAEEIARQAEKRGIVQEVLIQINIGSEETKGGYPPAEGMAALGRLAQRRGLRVKGFMAMLPPSQDEALLQKLCGEMRALFEEARKERAEIEFLSMGMSGDWRLCVECGSNMVRIGSAIFGARN